jgi:hypothetical protein
MVIVIMSLFHTVTVTVYAETVKTATTAVESGDDVELSRETFNVDGYYFDSYNPYFYRVMIEKPEERFNVDFLKHFYGELNALTDANTYINNEGEEDFKFDIYLTEPGFIRITRENRKFYYNFYDLKDLVITITRYAHRIEISFNTPIRYESFISKGDGIIYNSYITRDLEYIDVEDGVSNYFNTFVTLIIKSDPNDLSPRYIYSKEIKAGIYGFRILRDVARFFDGKVLEALYGQNFEYYVP